MESKFISKVGDFIANNKKPLLYVGGAVVIVAIGYSVVKKLQGGIGGLLTNKSIGAKSFSPVQIDSKKSTISDEVADSYSNRLFNAMADWGSDSDTVYEILNKLQNKDDFRKVYNSFGVRSYAGNAFTVGGSPAEIAKRLGAYQNLDLIEWLNNEFGYTNPFTYALIKKTIKNANL